jgi:Xaa-Pro aminopeptidase
VLMGAPDTRAYTTFRQDNNFYYLTGVETPQALLLIDGIRHQSILFLPPQDKNVAQWEGSRLFPGPEACRQTGIDEVLDRARFREELEKRKGPLQVLYTPLAPYETEAVSRDRALEHDVAGQADEWDGRISREAAFEKSLLVLLGPTVRILDLSPILDDMRRIKDAQEIEQLRAAGRIGALGVKESIRSTRPGLFEYQVAARAEFAFLWNGAFGPAFFPIVGSGPNSCIVHYSKNNRQIASGDMVVMDFGPDYGYYDSDITRSFPASGKFSKEQAKIYQAVLDAYKASLEKVRPGATFEMLSDAVRKALKESGYESGLRHAVGHYVGMSVHDVGESKPFEAGVVIALEPGVYLPDRNLGIRIEDTVLVTKDGSEVLTRDVSKEIAEIEKLMAGKGIADEP